MLLKTENLSKAYESRKKGEPVFWAAREVCLEIPEGKTIGLLGPSGSGKSTVGQMIVGLASAVTPSGVISMSESSTRSFAYTRTFPSSSIPSIFPDTPIG